MKALLLDANGKLSLGETHAPDLFPNGVRVEVKAVGINRADILQAAGHYPPPIGTRGDILGLEYSGCVIEVGSAVRQWTVGDRVMGVPGASYAEQVMVHEGECMRIPRLRLGRGAAILKLFSQRMMPFGSWKCEPVKPFWCMPSVLGLGLQPLSFTSHGTAMWNHSNRSKETGQSTALTLGCGSRRVIF